MARRKDDPDLSGRMPMKKFLKVLLILFLIPVVLVAAFLVIGNLSQGSNAPKTIGGQTAQVSDALAETWKTTPSDIEGMTKWDKYKAGLSVSAGSDTDGDGLTDKEELEVYKTDPLKVSSSGDLYSDGYKVRNGMDTATAYDYEGHQTFPYNSCPEVTLTAKSPTDFNAVVTALEGVESVSGLQVYGAYRVYNYGGNFSADLGELLARENLTLSDISVYVSDGKDLKPTSFSQDGSTVTLRKAFSSASTYTVYITEKNFLSFATASLGSIGTPELPDLFDIPTEEEEITGAGLVMVSPILTELAGKPFMIYTERLLSPNDTAQLQSKIIAYTEQILGAGYPHTVEEKSGIEINITYDLLKSMVSFLDITHLNGNQLSWYHLLFVYYSYEDRIAWETSGAILPGSDGSYTPDTEALRSTPDPVSGFDPVYDTLPFGNFKTADSPNGSCAGISRLTAYLYNQKMFPSRGGNWDLTGDSENYTLCDPGLSDFKNDSFITDHSSDGQTLTEDLTAGETEFTKMIAQLYLEGNANAEFICFDLLGGDFHTAVQDYAVIEGAMSYLDQGKILDVYLGMVDGTRHTVNIYSYRVSPENPDLVEFLVYDCNFPRNDIGDLTVSSAGFTIQVEKRPKLSGEGFTFSFDYFPLESRSYGATSNPDISDNNLILILDEFGHPVND